MTKLEKLYSIIENSRDVGVKLPKGVLQQVEELEVTVHRTHIV
jgi:phage-related holin